MIKTLLYLLVLTMASYHANANIHLINRDEIGGKDSFAAELDFLYTHEHIYNHWVPHWVYEVDSIEVVATLKSLYDSLATLKEKNVETVLMLGNIAHYLYNLGQEEYFAKAVSRYEECMNLSDDDYRAYWFLANHYAHSALQPQSIDYFNKAKAMPPAAKPEHFWNDYAFATTLAGMPSHSILAMDKVREISGVEGWFERAMGRVVREKFQPVDKDSSYINIDIWSVGGNEFVSFACRPLGIRFFVDTTWSLDLTDYQDRSAAATILPEPLTADNGRSIGVTIGLIANVVDSVAKLEEFVERYVSRYANKERFDFSDRYDKTIAYRISDNDLYADRGGARLYFIAIERPVPENPGLLIEDPMLVPHNNSGEIDFYSIDNQFERIDSRMFYLLILDSCADVHDDSMKLFKNFFDEQLIIE